MSKKIAFLFTVVFLLALWMGCKATTPEEEGVRPPPSSYHRAVMEWSATDITHDTIRELALVFRDTAHPMDTSDHVLYSDTGEIYNRIELMYIDCNGRWIQRNEDTIFLGKFQFVPPESLWVAGTFTCIRGEYDRFVLDSLGRGHAINNPLADLANLRVRGDTLYYDQSITILTRGDYDTGPPGGDLKLFWSQYGIPDIVDSLTQSLRAMENLLPYRGPQATQVRYRWAYVAER